MMLVENLLLSIMMLIKNSVVVMNSPLRSGEIGPNTIFYIFPQKQHMKAHFPKFSPVCWVSHAGLKSTGVSFFLGHPVYSTVCKSHPLHTVISYWTVCKGGQGSFLTYYTIKNVKFDIMCKNNTLRLFVVCVTADTVFRAYFKKIPLGDKQLFHQNYTFFIVRFLRYKFF